VLQQQQAAHLKGQLQAARQALAGRERGQAAAVIKVREWPLLLLVGCECM
jgi:hypothetical protein